jgi:hypothetical protein
LSLRPVPGRCGAPVMSLDTVSRVGVGLTGSLCCAATGLGVLWLAGGAAHRSLQRRYDTWHRARFSGEGHGRP